MSRRLGRGHCAPGDHTRFRTARGARRVIEQIRVQSLRLHRRAPRLTPVRCPWCRDWRITHPSRAAAITTDTAAATPASEERTA